MYRQLRVAVVIPAYNEEAAIEAAVQSVPTFVDRIYVVDDCSRDRTAELARRCGREVEVIQHRVNRGVGAAIVSGYRAALDASMDAVAVMAGDGQMDPEDLPYLLDPIAEGAVEYAKGNRFGHQELLVQMPPIRVLGNSILSVATKLTSGYRHVFDSQCGYTAISAEALARLDREGHLDRIFPRYGYPNDMLARLHVIGARVVDVPVRPIYGPSWRSGVKWHTVVYPVSYVLMASWWKRRMAEGRATPSAPTTVPNEDPRTRIKAVP